MVKLNQRTLRAAAEVFLYTYFTEGTEDRVLIYAHESLMVVKRTPMIRHRDSVVCDVELTIEREGRLWDLAFDLHSHHTMGAFWSPTDDANERIRGPVFGVCSWQNGWPPEWLFRRWDGKGFLDLAFDEVITDA